MLIDLTKKYVEAFGKKDIASVSELLLEDFVLEDPVVKRIEGKEEVLKAMQGIFSSCEQLSFIVKNIFLDKETTIIEFILQLDDTVLTGTDIIEWQDNKMKELRAYLDIPCEGN